MANLTQTSEWSEVLQLELTTPARAGAGEVMNSQAQSLLNRTKFLRDMIEERTVFEINSQIGTTYNLILSDTWSYVRCNNSNPISVNVPTNATVAFEIGTQINIRQVGDGQVTLIPAGGVLLNTPETLKTRKRGSTVTLIKVATNEWDVVGDLEAL